MLVLSRRLEEKIVLPTVPALIKVISAQTGLVRLGIDAHSSVPILREELTRTERATTLLESATAVPDEGESLFHQVRNRLNNLMLGLTLLRLNLDDADPVVRRTLSALEDEIHALREKLTVSGTAELTAGISS